MRSYTKVAVLNWVHGLLKSTHVLKDNDMIEALEYAHSQLGAHINARKNGIDLMKEQIETGKTNRKVKVKRKR